MSKSKNQSQTNISKSGILNYLELNSHRPQTLNDFYNHFDLYDKQEKRDLRQLLDELEEAGKVYRQGRGKYSLEPEEKNDLITGKLDLVNPNFGFIRYDENQSDIFVSKDDLHGAMHGDEVSVHITRNFRRKDKNPEGEIIEILKRARESIVGKIKVYPNYALVTPDVKGFFDKIYISKDNIHGAKTDDLVIVDLITFPDNHIQATGIVKSILGKSGDNDAEMNAIMAEFGLPIHFHKDVVEEANRFNDEISSEEIKKRRDFREILTITIDPEDAKDFDDAISFRMVEKGHYEIGVHIADVTHFVRPGTKLDAEAYRRATSVYLVDRTIPMLPEKLSNDLCSLKPGVERLTFSAVFELDDQARVIKQWFGKTIIRSDQRLSYESAQELIDSNTSEVLRKLNDLALNLRKQRMQNGAFNFESDEVKFELDEKGKPLGVSQVIRKDTHKLIEEFMLLANKQVASFVSQKSKPGQPPFTMVYRIHEPPVPEKMETFARFAGKMGYVIKTDSEKQLTRSLNQLMQEIEGKPIQNIIESLAIRTMSKAIYSTQNSGHFGLAFENYTHFTAPIRRYPDFMVHRLLERYLDGGKSANEEEYEKKCDHCSDMEKLAAEAERASIKYKQVEYMSLQPKNIIYSGIVSGVTDFGIFVELHNMGAEGLARLADLEDDFYEYDADNYRVVGRRTQKIIGFGNEVKVIVTGTNLDERSISLQLISVDGKNFNSAPVRKPKLKGRREPGRRRR